MHHESFDKVRRINIRFKKKKSLSKNSEYQTEHIFYKMVKPLFSLNCFLIKKLLLSLSELDGDKIQVGFYKFRESFNSIFNKNLRDHEKK